MIYIYLKTHNVTGLKYLGKTERDPFKYCGSGVLWTRHLKKYGKNIATIILAECETKEEARNKGIYFSELYNIVDSKEFANLVVEAGEGHNKGVKLDIYTEDRNNKISQKVKNHWKENKEKRSKQNKNRTWKLSPENAKKVSQYIINGPKDNCKNTIWINNGICDKRIPFGMELPDGFIKGRLLPPWNKKGN